MGNPEIDQLMGRLNSHRGKFGLLICRSIKNRKLLTQRCKDVLNDHQSYIIVLDDSDMINLLKFRDINDEKQLDKYMNEKLSEIIM